MVLGHFWLHKVYLKKRYILYRDTLTGEVYRDIVSLSKRKLHVEGGRQYVNDI